jgi:hypothetical protein
VKILRYRVTVIGSGFGRLRPGPGFRLRAVSLSRQKPLALGWEGKRDVVSQETLVYRIFADGFADKAGGCDVFFKQ